jgi:tetratricopeptide (TPR) repeat protein
MMKSSLLIVMLAATAHASVWDRAVTSPEDEVAKDLYNTKMTEGDASTLASTIESASLKTRMAAVKRAEAAYRAAASIRPREGEPYFRIGNLVYEVHFDCDQGMVQPLTCRADLATPERMQTAVDAWDEFEKRAPLDPRVGEILLERAILNTKLVNGTAADKRHLEAAARDYQAALDRSDGLTTTGGDEQLLGNLAETYMMLDRLDESIATYLQAVAVGAARVSTVYGLAVALDRDGSGDQALRRIQSQGSQGFDAFDKDYHRGAVFFVPAGEANYYFALAHEAFGNLGTALEFWNRYLASGAHPEFHARAREHVARLHKKRVRPEPPPLSPDDL